MFYSFVKIKIGVDVDLFMFDIGCFYQVDLGLQELFDFGDYIFILGFLLYGLGLVLYVYYVQVGFVVFDCIDGFFGMEIVDVVDYVYFGDQCFVYDGWFVGIQGQGFVVVVQGVDYWYDVFQLFLQ